MLPGWGRIAKHTWGTWSNTCHQWSNADMPHSALCSHTEVVWWLICWRIWCLICQGGILSDTPEFMLSDLRMTERLIGNQWHIYIFLLVIQIWWKNTLLSLDSSQSVSLQIDGLMQDWSTSSALVMEILQSYIKPSKLHEKKLIADVNHDAEIVNAVNDCECWIFLKIEIE